MSATTELRRTAFNPLHKRLGARFVDFHGWELPIQFTSILKEHQAVRTGIGIFDVSHMGQVLVEGRQAAQFLDHLNSNDIRRLVAGRAVYSHLLNEAGGVVDDVIISCFGLERFMVVVNSATCEKDVRWLERHSEGYEVQVEDLSRFYAMLAIQGPMSERIVAELSPAAGGLVRFGALEADLFGQRAILQRTGYTGEDGFEILVPNDLGSRLWEEVMTRGRSFGIAACGLGARDTLRLEAGYLLYGQDIDEDHTPLEAGYDWVVKFAKPDFLGKEPLTRQQSGGLRRKLTGVRLLEAGVPRAGAGVYLGESKLGVLSSATFSPTFQVGIGMGYLERVDLAPGQKLDVEIHGRRVCAEVARLPFYSKVA